MDCLAFPVGFCLIWWIFFAQLGHLQAWEMGKLMESRASSQALK